MTPPPAARPRLPGAAPLFAAGLCALYVAERTLSGLAQQLGDALAALLLGLALVRTATRGGGAEVRRALGRSYLTACAGVALYVAIRLGAAPALHAALPPQGVLSAVQTATLCQVLVWVFLGWGLLPAMAMEMALHAMRETPMLELWRLQLARRSAHLLCLTLISFAALNFAALTWNRKIDLSYFKTARPSATTLALVEHLDTPLQITLFFPPGNDVLEQVRSYVSVLQRASPQVQLRITDQALDPARARALQVRSNGTVALEAHNKHETLHLDLDAERARSLLARLDGQIQQRLIRVLRPPRQVYLTTGHNERDYVPGPDETRAALSDFKLLLEGQGCQVRRLGLAEGLGRAIPGDATLVAIIGATAPLTAMERQALRSYLQAGGRLLVALDAEAARPDAQLLAMLGLHSRGAMVAHAQYLVRMPSRRASPYDLALLQADDHPAATSLHQNFGRQAVVMLGATALQPVPGNQRRATGLADVAITPVLSAMPESWEDTVQNGVLDSGKEAPSELPLISAVQWQPPTPPSAAPAPGASRALVAGDADFIADGVLGNVGNAALAVDMLRWLLGDETTSAPPTDEVDIPLVRHKQDDAVWFYGVCYGMPALVLATGLLGNRRRQRRRRPPQPN